MIYNNIEVLWEQSGVTLSFFGVVDFKEIYQTNSQLTANSYFDTADFQVWDFSQVSKIIATEQDALVLASLDKAMTVWKKSMKVAIITTSPFLIQITNAYINYMNKTDWTCRIFSSRLEAQVWIAQS
jgi:hypothetical protein